jgi:hypothetical protein
MKDTLKNYIGCEVKIIEYKYPQYTNHIGEIGILEYNPHPLGLYRINYGCKNGVERTFCLGFDDVGTFSSFSYHDSDKVSFVLFRENKDLYIIKIYLYQA